MDNRQPQVLMKRNPNCSWINPKSEMVRIRSHLENETPRPSKPVPDGKEQPQPSKPAPDECICHCSKVLVLCRICAYMRTHTITRFVRTVCPIHPQAIYLMDLEQCPSCHGYGILREYPVD